MSKPTTIMLEIPRPPSVNTIWRSRRGHGGKPTYYLNRRYQTWKRACDNLCLANGWHKNPVKGRFVCTIVIDEMKRRGDCDNRIKATLDWLRRAKITDDDSFCDRVTAEWGYAPEGCRVFLTPVAVREERRAAA